MAMRRSLPVGRALFPATGLSRTTSGHLSSVFVAKQRNLPERRSGRPRDDRSGRVLLPSGEAASGSGVRRLGMWDSIQDKMTDRNASKQEEEFRKHVNQLAEMESFDLNDFYKLLEEPLSKWTAKMPWNTKQEELVTMKKQKEILESIPVAQRSNPSLIRERQKAAIAEKAQCSVEEVHSLLFKFREMRGMSNWLVERKRLGQQLPQSAGEVQEMLADPSGVPLTKFMKKKVAKSGQGMSFTF